MKQLSKLLAILLFMTGVSFGQSNVCKAKTDEAKKLAEKCKTMDRKSNDFQQCRSSYNLLRQQVKNACEGGQSIEQLKKNVQQWQEFVDGCKGRQDVRCANALHSLGTFTFRLEDLQHLQVMQKFEEEVAWCADRDNKPAKCKDIDQLPKADHKKSLAHFMDFIKKYSKDPKMPNVLYQAAAVLESTMEDEKAYKLRLKLVQDWPNDGLVPKAWLRIGEYFFMNRKYRDAIEAYKKVTGFDNLTGKEAALAMYHLAESYYNIAEYETAAIKYFDYIVGSDAGKYPSDLRQEAMDFMAASFADMDDGVDVASRFIKNKKVAFKDSLFFRIGMKNKDHDRNEQAVECFNYLLDINPNYVDAPLADIAMVEILVKQEKLPEAHSHRLKVVKRYDKNSSWYKSNQKYPESVRNAENAIRQAMLDIPQYHHAEAARITKTGDTEAGKAEYRKAIKAYNDFLQRYAKEPSWDEYKVYINLALVYQNLNEFDNAAARFNWIDDVDTTKYGRRHDKLGQLIAKNEAAYNAVLMMDQNREQAVKNKAQGDEVKGYALPETKAYFAQVDRYMAKWGKQKDAPSLAYNAAVVHYNAKQYSTAITVLAQLRKDFPKHEHTLIISRMLAQANLENGNLDEAQKEFEWLWTQYAKVKETRNDSMATEIDKAIAAVLFQKADKSVKDGKFEQGATAYLALVKRYPTADFADKAIFEAAVAYESAKMYKASAETFMLLPRQYSSSPLTVRGIMRAAQAHTKDNNPREAAHTFLFITENFPKDSAAYDAIGWAAGVYNTASDGSKTQADSANYKKLAAQTYEIAYKKYPQHEKTPSMLYSACLSYEQALVTEEAIRCNKDLVRSYPKSSYALDAAFSIPMAYQTAKKWSEAAAEFVNFTKAYTSDKEKLIAAHYGAAKAYLELKNDKNAQDQFRNVISTYDKFGLQIANADPAIPAEAAFVLGEYIYEEMNAIHIKGNDKSKQQAIKNLTAKLQAAMSQYAKSAGYASEKWTFKATNKMGGLFVTMAAKIREQDINGKDELEIFAERIMIVQQLPSFYEQAMPMFEKNIILARDQGFYNADVIAAEEGYIEMNYQNCAAFFEVADAFANSPRLNKAELVAEYIEEGLAKEDAEMMADDEVEAYNEEIEGKVRAAREGGVPKCVTGIKASQHYQIDNQWTAKLYELVKLADAENEALSIKIVKFDPTTLFRDTRYFRTKARLEQIASSEVMTAQEQIKTYRDIIKEAKTDNVKLKEELAQLQKRLNAIEAESSAQP